MQGRRQQGRFFTFQPIWIGSISLLLVVLAAGLFLRHSGALLSSDHETRNVSPASAFTIRPDPKPLQKVSSATPGTSNSTTPAVVSSSPVAGTSNVSTQNNNSDSSAARCTYDLSEAQKSYNHEVEKEKASLDSTLSFKVGLNISSQYIIDYNKKVTGIFNEYQGTAQSNHCVWPIKEPPLLPSTYTR
jgi:hypothetical protein